MVLNFVYNLHVYVFLGIHRERGLFLGTGSRDVILGPAVLKSVGQAGRLKTQS